MFKIGDRVKTTALCEYVDLSVGTEGMIVDILPAPCPYPFIVDFNDDLDTDRPVQEQEIERV